MPYTPMADSEEAGRGKLAQSRRECPPWACLETIKAQLFSEDVFLDVNAGTLVQANGTKNALMVWCNDH